MSAATLEREAPEANGLDLARRDGVRLREVPGHLARVVVGVFLCTTLPTALVAVGWTFRLLRRRFLHGVWRRSPVRAVLSFAEFAEGRGGDVPAGPTPRWLVSERIRQRLGRPAPDGTGPGPWRFALRLPGALLAGLGANVRAGVAALACTSVLTLPGGLFLLGGWEYGWNISFYKGYEQAFVGRSVAFVGALMLASAMLYVPMASAHLAATGDPRAFFQFRFVRRLIRRRLAALTLYAAGFALLMAPATFLWMFVQFFPQSFPWLADARPEELEAFATRYRMIAAWWIFPAYLAVHLLAMRIYRGALLGVLASDPEAVSSLHPGLRGTLEALELLPDSPRPRRHPVVAAVLGTGRRGTNAVLWAASFLLWMLVPAQMLVMQFFVWHPWLVWLNPVLIHLPCLWVAPTVG